MTSIVKQNYSPKWTSTMKRKSNLYKRLYLCGQLFFLPKSAYNRLVRFIPLFLVGPSFLVRETLTSL